MYDDSLRNMGEVVGNELSSDGNGFIICKLWFPVKPIYTPEVRLLFPYIP